MTISRTRFYKWLNSYTFFKHNLEPQEGRDQVGRWIIFRNLEEEEEIFQSKIEF